jgi:hypothetical protein
VRRTPLRRSTRKADPVTPEVRLQVLDRDQGCVAVKLGEDPLTCRGRLTLDHVKDQPRMGRRAESTPSRLVSVCEWHHLYGWATANRPALREYLRGVA